MMLVNATHTTKLPDPQIQASLLNSFYYLLHLLQD